jgi:hypothetical protein
MGSRPPRKHTPPKPPRQPRPAQPSESAQTGLRMETLSVFIGLAAFPVAIGAAGVAYIARQEASSIATAAILTVVVAAILILLARSRRQWRRDTRISNELLLAMLIATMATAFLIGGAAGLSAIWIAAGAIMLLVAWFVGRSANPTFR